MNDQSTFKQGNERANKMHQSGKHSHKRSQSPSSQSDDPVKTKCLPVTLVTHEEEAAEIDKSVVRHRPTEVNAKRNVNMLKAVTVAARRRYLDL
ncbi:hypothetical protein AJ78_00472 [Emergomyces pasteurianus Ep9510]|uniref:Uncharacterized protein n=1 Tax=Emergomyces pasteurianus Ep9510 TaxID=1447872 RepID=A0A1J9QTU1_9EURO|nr:hypothetical protein AJ78_00472 [Emergomyces pasteurianus Ep9510]